MSDFQKVIRYWFTVNQLGFLNINYLDKIVLDVLCFKTSHGTSLIMKYKCSHWLLKVHTLSCEW